MEQELREELQKIYDFLVETKSTITGAVNNEIAMDICHNISERLVRIDAILNP